MVMDMPAHILLVEDEFIQQTLVKEILVQAYACAVTTSRNGHEALYYLKQRHNNIIDLVIMDLSMPDMGGFQTLAKIRELYAGLPVIILTGSEDLSDAVKSIKMGAHDFITKPVHAGRIITSIDNICKTQSLEKEVQRLRCKTGEAYSFENMIGHDSGLYDVVTVARRAAPSDIPVLITGESGVGKELFARAIHQASGRANNGPFIAVNCGAIPEKLVESTLFGHEKGSFTGATTKRTGKFLEAHNGTLFLDEVGELPLETQVKLLRALQQHEIEPVGSSEPVYANTRIISATNRSLSVEIHEGNFREDLYFRLNGMPVDVPPLRTRTQDIPALLDYFIDYFARKHQRTPPVLQPEALDFLCSYTWPGNVRELESAIFRTVLLDTTGIVTKKSFQAFLKNTPAPHHATLQDQEDSIVLVDNNGTMKTLDSLEWEIIGKALDRHQGNVILTAHALGIGKSTLYRRIESEKQKAGAAFKNTG